MFDARLVPEPFCAVQKLPGCPSCGARHPLAHNPPREAGRCPVCGARLAAPEKPVEVPAVLTGPGAVFRAARALLAIGAALRALSKRL
ncbi:MAG TPA: hypothetical protein VEC60_18835 [Reyranella sp.]|nr:hypothetical protein [Reyranella sp.]